MKIPRYEKDPAELIASGEVAKLAAESAWKEVETLVACGVETYDEDAAVVPGAEFVIPVVILEETPTGDNRSFVKDALTVRDLPLPLMWQMQTASGHSGSVVVGRIDYIERIDNEHGTGLGNARGVFDTGVWGREAERLVREGMMRGVSADLDEFEGTAVDIELSDEDESTGREIKNEEIIVNKARLTGVTLVYKPAMQEAYIELIDPYHDIEIVELPIEDGMYTEEHYDEDDYHASLVAAGAPLVPPRDWFRDPGLKQPTPIEVTDDGKVYGHIALWNVDHIGLPRATKPPRSASNYAYFRTGVIRTDDGSDVPVGQLTLAGGHASMSASADEAVKHYDDTASAMADVSAGEDAHGIWISGALRTSATPEQVRALRASAPSGDWRPIRGRLELVAVCQVNVPGFPTVRSMVAGGQVTALVAAGARPLAELRSNKVEDRLAELETIEFERQKNAALDRLNPVIEEDRAALVASAEKARQILNPMVDSYKERLHTSYEDARKRLGLA